MEYVWAGIIFWYLIIFVYKTKTGSPTVPSKDTQIARFLKYVKRGDNVADLGCGDGRVLFSTAKKGASGEGWEIEPLPYLYAVIRAMRKKNSKVKIHFADMWKADLSKFDVVFVYQLTRYAPRFVRKCQKEMKRGALVIANTYPLDGLYLLKKDGELYVYQIR